MSLSMKKGMMYRMPMHFGPTAAPRQGPHGADLPVIEYRAASIVESQGGKDLGDQKRLA
jgi:hypothetical protein